MAEELGFESRQRQEMFSPHDQTVFGDNLDSGALCPRVRRPEPAAHLHLSPSLTCGAGAYPPPHTPSVLINHKDDLAFAVNSIMLVDLWDCRERSLSAYESPEMSSRGQIRRTSVCMDVRDACRFEPVSIFPSQLGEIEYEREGVLRG
jgi:hypothetical protein